MQAAFRECHGLQCGFCTPGMVMSAVQLLADNPKATEEEIREGLDGNICRCTGYHNIVKSIQFCQSGEDPDDGLRSSSMGNMNEAVDPSKSPIGQSVRRREDRRFITGAGHYTDDVVLQGQTYGVFLRSPHAHARIRSIDLAAAKKAPGVVDIITGADLADAKVGGLPCGWLIHSKDGTPMKEPAHPVLAQGKVRHVGDQVALVVAETLLQAKDAAELVVVDYEELPAVIDLSAADSIGTAVHDDVPDNVCYDWGHGDKAAVEAAFAKAAHVTKLSFVNNRLIPNAIEPRAANAAYNRSDESYTLYVANQNPHVERLLMCAFVLGLPESKVRVIAPDVGGGFGSKIFLYPGRRRAGLGEQARRPADQVDGRAQRIVPHRRARPRPRHDRRDGDGRGTATSWRCASRRSPTWAPTCRPSRRRCRRSSTRRCSPASTRRRRSTPRSRRCSPTPRRSTPTAAPAARRRPTSSSASSSRRRAT